MVLFKGFSASARGLKGKAGASAAMKAFRGAHFFTEKPAVS